MRVNREDRDLKFKRINEGIQNLEKNKIIIDYKKFVNLPHTEQMKIRAVWEKYYEDVKSAPICALFQAQLAAAKINDWGRVKELAKDARLMRENGDNTTLAVPSCPDPAVFDFGEVVMIY